MAGDRRARRAGQAGGPAGIGHQTAQHRPASWGIMRTRAGKQVVSYSRADSRTDVGMGSSEPVTRIFQGVRRSLCVTGTTPAKGTNMLTDIWVVTSEGWNGRHNARRVLAGDEDQARHAHLEHYPDEQIVTVRPQPTSA